MAVQLMRQAPGTAPPHPHLLLSAQGGVLALPGVGSSTPEASLRPHHGGFSGVVHISAARATVARRGSEEQCTQTHEKATKSSKKA